MGDFFNWLSTNPIATITLIILFGIVITSTTLIYVVAFIQGREIVFWPPKIGERHNKSHTKNLEKEFEKGQQQGFLNNHDLYLNRKEVHWPQYNEKVSRRFWACGTSLIGVFERELIRKYFNNGVRDIKILLPNTDNPYLSYEQLEKYNRVESGLVGNQVDLAKVAFEMFETITLSGMEKSEFLKKYSGIMFSNITIFDDDAFISFYDYRGIGDSNFTLHFDRNLNKIGYDLVESEFLRMWNAKMTLGVKNKKKMGTSIFFINNMHQVLLFLRDNKKSIPFPNCWDALGGNVKSGETPLNCIIREMDEEIGIKLETPNLFNVYDMNDRIECAFWKKENLDINKINLTEGQRLKWFAEQDINKMVDSELAFGFKSIILDFFQQKPFDNVI